MKNINLNIAVYTIILLIFCGIFSNAYTLDDKGKESELKAVFIYNFTKYIQWPDSGNDVFEIAVLGENDVLQPLQEIADKRMVNGKEISVKFYENISDITGCHMLFISSAFSDQLEDVLKIVNELPILTISDSADFAKRGVAINFVILDEKLKFQINPAAIERAGLVASSQLQKLAIIIQEEKN